MDLLNLYLEDLDLPPENRIKFRTFVTNCRDMQRQARPRPRRRWLCCDQAAAALLLR